MDESIQQEVIVNSITNMTGLPWTVGQYAYNEIVP